MFTEFTSQVWTSSDASLVIADNTDYKFTGASSKQLTWADGANQFATMTFDAVTLSAYEEISLHVHMTDILDSGNIFKITIDGADYIYNRFTRGGWNHLLIDCRAIGSVTTIVITSLVADLNLFVDYIGYRKVTHSRDNDVLEAFAAKISLDYDQATTLSALATAGDTSVSLTSKHYIYDHTIIELDDGAGTTEQIQLLSRNGNLNGALVNDYPVGSTVKAICPTERDDFSDVEPDPICGITTFDRTPDKRYEHVRTKNVTKMKMFTGTLGILVYINSTSEMKLHQLSREYDYKYGERFQILLDGEKVDIILENDTFVPDVIGNKPRSSYFYRIEPSSYFVAAGQYISNGSVSLDSIDPELAFATVVRS